MKCTVTICLNGTSNIYVECNTLSELLEAIDRIEKYKKDKT